MVTEAIFTVSGVRDREVLGLNLWHRYSLDLLPPMVRYSPRIRPGRVRYVTDAGEEVERDVDGKFHGEGL